MTAFSAGRKLELESTGIRDWHLLFHGGAPSAGGAGGSGSSTPIAGGGGGGAPTTAIGPTPTGSDLGSGVNGANGGAAVTAGEGAAGAAGAYPGGRLYIEVGRDVDLSASGRISADGGTGGTGGSGGTSSRVGGGGGGGSAGAGAGFVVLLYTGTDVNTTVDAAHVHATAGAGGTGGIGGVGGTVSGGAGGNADAGEDGFVFFRKVA